MHKQLEAQRKREENLERDSLELAAKDAEGEAVRRAYQQLEAQRKRVEDLERERLEVEAQDAQVEAMRKLADGQAGRLSSREARALEDLAAGAAPEVEEDEKGVADDDQHQSDASASASDRDCPLKAELRRTRVDVPEMGRRTGFEDVVGLEAAKRALREAVLWPALADPELFSGVRGAARGLLLYGPPGCGKTMLARAAAGELADRVAFFHVRPGDVMSKYYGDPQQKIQALEELVAEAAPAVVFFDEVDTLLGSRDAAHGAEHHRATTNAMLAWMDGFSAGSERVFFLGATNRAEAIDEAALRRFGDAVEVEAPCRDARLALVRHLCGRKAATDGHLADLSPTDFEAVSDRTEGYSLADVDRLVRRAFLQVLRELPGGVRPGLRPSDVPPVRFSHFETALCETTGTPALRAKLRKQGRARRKL